MFKRNYRYYMTAMYKDKEGNTGQISFFITGPKKLTTKYINEVLDHIDEDYNYEASMIIFLQRLERVK